MCLCMSIIYYSTRITQDSFNGIELGFFPNLELFVLPCEVGQSLSLNGHIGILSQWHLSTLWDVRVNTQRGVFHLYISMILSCVQGCEYNFKLDLLLILAPSSLLGNRSCPSPCPLLVGNSPEKLFISRNAIYLWVYLNNIFPPFSFIFLLQLAHNDIFSQESVYPWFLG